MKPLVVAAFILALAAAPVVASAQQAAPAPAPSATIDPTVKAAALRVVKAATPEANFRAVAVQMGTMMSTQMLQGRGVPKATADDLVKIMSQEMATLDLAPIYEFIADGYAARFTLADLATMEAFYKSPTGQKMIAAQPELAQVSLAAGQMWGQRVLGPRVTARMSELMRQRNLQP